MTHRTYPHRLIAALLAAVLALAAPLRAQQQQPPLQLVGIAPAGDPNEVVANFFMAEMPLADVLQQLELLTGRSVIRTQALPTPTITFNNGMQRQQFTRAELVIAIESLLSLNGIGLTPLGDKFIKVVPLAQVQQEAPELVVGSVRELPSSGRIVSKLFRLQYLDPQQFQQQLGAFLSLGKVATFQNSNTVIVTDTISNLQRVETLLVEIDKRLNIETKFYQIRYASATDLAQAIRSTIDSAKSGSTGGRVVVQQGGQPPPPMPGGAPGAAAGSAQQVVLSTNTAINADERTNQLIIITDPANIPFFDDMIAKLDVPADPPTAIEVIPMRYADAEELSGLLSQFTANRSSSSRRSSSDSRSGGRNVSTPFPNLQPTLPQNPLLNQRQQVVQDTVQAATEGSGATQFSELLTIQPDTRTNALVVSGTVSDLRLIKEVIEKLDVLLAQVRIEVVIAEVSLTGGLTRGIDAFSLAFTDSGTATSVGSGDGKITTPAVKGGFAGSTAFGPISGVVTGILNDGRLEDPTIAAVLGAGRTDNRINILSTPTIATMHNKEAKLIVGQSQPIVTGTTQSGISDNVTSSFQYQDIATQLTVTPKVGPNNVIEMEIDQQIDDIAPGGGTDVNGTNQPTIARRQASSTVAVKDGQLIVLGGLQKNSTSKNKSHMFILGEIPLLDKIFTRTTQSTNRTELVVFIKPKVIRTTDEADADARELLSHVHLSEENADGLEKIVGTPVNPPPVAPPTTQDAAAEPKGPSKPKRPANR